MATVPQPPPATAVCTEIQPGVWLDARLAVWLATERILVVADIHWGYAASHRARGNLLPAWGDDEIEQRLRSLHADYSPAEMIWLGDTVHAAEGGARAEAFLQEFAGRITLISGNHDRRWRIAGAPTARRGRFFLHHGDIDRAAPAGTCTLIGHHHPAVAWADGAGGNVKLPALVASPDRLVLPAFSPWAAGTSCVNLLSTDSQVWAIAPKRIFPIRSSSRASTAV